MKRMASTKKTVLYLYVRPQTKAWLKRLCAKQIGRVTQSTMVEQVFAAVQELGIFDRKTKENKNGKA